MAVRPPPGWPRPATNCVVPERVLHPLPQNLKRRLREEDLLLGHVEVVNEDDQFLASGRRPRVLGPLLHLGLDVVRHARRLGAGREVDGSGQEALSEQAEGRGDDGRFADTDVTGEHHMPARMHQGGHQVAVAHGVRGRHQDLVEGRVGRDAEGGGELLFPVSPGAALGLDKVLEDRVLVRVGRFQLPHVGVDHLAPLLVDGGAERPDERVEEAELDQLGGALAVGRRAERVKQPADRPGRRYLRNSDGLFDGVPEREALGQRPVDQALQLLADGALLLREPRVDIRPPAELRGVDVDHAGARDGGGRGD
eukprot:scaffold8907_cov105-Isochrysis_galbana.AAC.4